MSTDPIQAFMTAELDRTVEPATMALAEAAMARVGGVRAVLFYGSCLRDGLATDAVADLYLLTDGYKSTGQAPWARMANGLLAPNVFYIEAETPLGQIAAKAAIVSVDDFVRLTGPKTFHSYFWARFTQPAAVVWANGQDTRQALARAFAAAARTFAAETAEGPLAPGASDQFWPVGFQKTYASELRAEGPERAEILYRADADRYRALYDLLQADGVEPLSAPRRWRLRRMQGKFLSVARLAKAIFTFENGVDYVLWKVKRHSGVHIEAKPWQRRFPLIAAPGLAFKVWRAGGFR
jgi:hypothetical protein